jgi:hypothetical protein
MTSASGADSYESSFEGHEREPLASLLIRSRRSMDRTQLCGSCNVGSIPTESTHYKVTFLVAFIMCLKEQESNQKGVGETGCFPVEEVRGNRGFHESEIAKRPTESTKTKITK